MATLGPAAEPVDECICIDEDEDESTEEDDG